MEPTPAVMEAGRLPTQVAASLRPASNSSEETYIKHLQSSATLVIKKALHGVLRWPKKLASCSAEKGFSTRQPRPEKVPSFLLTIWCFPLEPRTHFPDIPGSRSRRAGTLMDFRGHILSRDAHPFGWAGAGRTSGGPRCPRAPTGKAGWVEHPSLLEAALTPAWGSPNRTH